MKTFNDITPYNGQGTAACVIGVDHFAIDVSGSPEYRQGDPWLRARCGKMIEKDSLVLERLSSFRIVGKLTANPVTSG